MTSSAHPLRLVAAAALIDPDARVLIAQRPKHKPWPGAWEFPGGKIEPGETPEAAIIRELNEELGIDVSASCLAPLAFASHPYPEFHLILMLFICRIWDGTPKPLEEQTLKWLPKNKLTQHDMLPANKILAACLRDTI